MIAFVEAIDTHFDTWNIVTLVALFVSSLPLLLSVFKFQLLVSNMSGGGRGGESEFCTKFF